MWIVIYPISTLYTSVYSPGRYGPAALEQPTAGETYLVDPPLPIDIDMDFIPRLQSLKESFIRLCYPHEVYAFQFPADAHLHLEAVRVAIGIGKCEVPSVGRLTSAWNISLTRCRSPSLESSINVALISNLSERLADAEA